MFILRSTDSVFRFSCLALLTLGAAAACGGSSGDSGASASDGGAPGQDAGGSKDGAAAADTGSAIHDGGVTTTPDGQAAVDSGNGGQADSGGTTPVDSGTATDSGAPVDSGAVGDAGLGGWVGTWSTADQLVEMNSTMNNNPPGELSNSTLRQNVYVSVGGSTLRLRLSNAYSTSPVTMNSVHVAASMGGSATAGAATTASSAIDTATDTALSFSGKASVTIAPGQTVMSDPFPFALSPLELVSITIAFGAAPPSTAQGLTGHPGSRETSYLQTGSMVSAASLPSAMTTQHWYYIQGIDVTAPTGTNAIIALGDSITDGRGSDTDGNDRWPDDLDRLLHAGIGSPVAVLNEGIGGNAVVTGGLGPTATSRFQSDVINQSGAKWLIVFEGVNDIGATGTPTIANDIIAAFGNFITEAHAAGMKVYGIPITPFGGSTYDSAGSQAARTTVNGWITTSGKYDAVIDLSTVVADPNNPTSLLAAYDSGDHLHPNAAGYTAMSKAIPLSLFGR